MYKHDFALYIKLLNFELQFGSLNAFLIGLVHSRIHNNNIMSIYMHNTAMQHCSTHYTLDNSTDF